MASYARTHASGKLVAPLILATALGLRLWGVGYGLPFILHPDENRQILDSLGMAERLSVFPEEFSYPALHKYMLVAVNGIYFIVGRLLGWFTGPADFALKFLEGRSSVLLLSRLVSVAFGTALCVLLYKMGRRLFSEKTGLIALVFSAGMFHLIQHSQWAIADIFLAFFTTASLCFIMLSVSEPDRRNTLCAFIFAGLAISTKPQGVFLLLPLLIGRVFVFRDSDSAHKKTSFLRETTLACSLLVSASLIGNLSWLFNFTPVYEKFRMLSQVAHLGISSKAPFKAGYLHLAGWFAADLARQEGALGVVLLAGVVYAAIKRSRKDLILLSYLALFLFAMKDWAIRYLHLFVAIFPVLCLFAARMTSDLLSKAKVRGRAAAALTLAVVLPSAAWSIDASIVKGSVDTRTEAVEWVDANIPAGALIAVDWYEFSIPLLSATPVYLQNPKAKKYFETKVNGSVKLGYEEYLKNRPVYRVIPVIYSTDSPNWPREMTPDAVSMAASKEVYRELYSVFNFRTVDELKSEGARYIIISSYGYTNFLLDEDPNKTAIGAYNYLFREDLLSFNRQSDSYDGKSPFGLLYFLNKRARDFYCPLLAGKTARLVKEFAPSERRPGPFIKIYEI